MKIKQNPVSGLAKIENGSSGVDFGSHFGSHFDALGHNFSDFSSFLVFCFSGLFFWCPGVPWNHENQAKPRSVARNQGLAKIENGASGVDFGSHFGSHVDASGHIFSDLSSFLAFCFSVFFLDAEKHANRPSNSVNSVTGYPVYPLNTCVSMSL